jgi:putative hydrolase of the HAD superfamily
MGRPRPSECLFVDDDPALVEAAIALGYRGIVLTRDGVPGDGVITTLPELPV